MSKFTCGSPCRIQRHYSLYSYVQTRNIECLKHYLEHALSVELWVQRGLSQQYREVLGLNTQLVIRVGPDLKI